MPRVFKMKYFDICSGVSAVSQAWKPLGWEAVGFAEIDKFPAAVLAQHYPDVPNFGDFTQITKDESKIEEIRIINHEN